MEKKIHREKYEVYSVMNNNPNETIFHVRLQP